MQTELFVCTIDKKAKMLALIKFLNFRLLQGKSTRVQISVDMSDQQIKLMESVKKGKVGVASLKGESGRTT